MASSSKSFSPSHPSSPRPRKKYDVFLSFRGEDTRKGITWQLNERLHKQRIKTFMDDQDLPAGSAISSTLLTAIEESSMAIVVLSRDYASSTWCLEELTKICQCMKAENTILPLFYNVDPSHVRKQTGSFEAAFTKHEQSGQDKDKMIQWRAALVKVASYSGWHTLNYKNDDLLLGDIVKNVSSKLSKVRPTANKSTGDFQIFEATREAKDKVMKALSNDEVTVVGVYGMGGVGKTSLVDHVGALAKDQGLFDHVVKVVITQKPQIMKIQGMLADRLGLTLDHTYETEEGRSDGLKLKILSGHKMLIIIDDIWEQIELSSIGIPSYEDLQICQSKLLLTTRRWNVCHTLECQASIPLTILSEDDSWKLFDRKARRTFELTEFNDVAKKVARECGGLPIALIAVARALGDKKLVEWTKAAERLKKSEAVNPDDNGDAFKCLKLSYDYLKDEDCKSWFLLCCLFPEDYDIPIKDLFKYAIGKGLFRGASTIEDARGEADTAAEHLIYSSLLFYGEEPECVRMHDVIRDTAMKIAALSKDGHGFLVQANSGLEDWPKMNSDEQYSAISLMDNRISKLPEELVCTKLQILLLQYNHDLDEIPETFFQSLTELRVLDLSSTSTLLLPESFSFLTNLRALYMDSCKKINGFSLLGKLEKLEILSMRYYPLKVLPREIGKLTKLRMLDVRSSCILTIPSGLISKLHCLEELYFHCGFWDWGSKVSGEGEEANASFNEVTSLPCLNLLQVCLKELYLHCGFWDGGSQVSGEGEEANAGFNEVTSLPRLKLLQVCIFDASCIPETVRSEPNWVYFDICISRNRISGTGPYGRKHPRSLSLDITIRNLPDWFINVVTKKSEILKYVECRGLNNILVEYDDGKLHALNHLSITGPCEVLKELMNATCLRNRCEPVFEKLEELHLKNVDSLTKLCVGELPPQSLSSLKLLTVNRCDRLENVLLPPKLLQRLSSLEKLTCWQVNAMKYVFECEEGFEPEQSSLRELAFCDLSSVISICNGPAPPKMFESLKDLFVVRCNFKGSLLTADVAHSLFQLEHLHVANCAFLERLIEVREETVNEKKVILPNLRSLSLERLPQLCTSESGTIDFECPLLDYLYVYDCPKFSASASDFKSKNQIHIVDSLHYSVQLGVRIFEEIHIWKNLSSAFSEVVATLEGIPRSVLKAILTLQNISNKDTNVESMIKKIYTNIEDMDGAPRETTDFTKFFLAKLPEIHRLLQKLDEIVEKMQNTPYLKGFEDIVYGFSEKVLKNIRESHVTQQDSLQLGLRFASMLKSPLDIDGLAIKNRTSQNRPEEEVMPATDFTSIIRKILDDTKDLYDDKLHDYIIKYILSWMRMRSEE